MEQQYPSTNQTSTTKPRMIVWFSCGAASAVAAKKSIDYFGNQFDVVVVNCDTRSSEHPDNYRFSSEVEKWIGQPVIYIKSSDYKDVDDVFEKTKYMSGVRGARCTTELKKVPRMKFASPDDTHVFGFTCNETKRMREFESRNPDMKLNWVLAELGLSKTDCLSKIIEAGIEIPKMYQIGFNNNNCPGCVKASSPWYWSMIRKHFPDVFNRRCEQSRKIGVRLVEIHHHERIFLDQLPQTEFKKPKKSENLSCGPECGIPNFPAPGSMTKPKSPPIEPPGAGNSNL